MRLAQVRTGRDVKEAVFAGPMSRSRAAARSGSVWWDDRFEAWTVSSHALVSHVMRSPEVFSSRELEFGPPAPHADTPILRSLLALDPPEHARLRQVVSRTFTPRALDRVEVMIADTAERLLTDAPAAPEIIDGFASPLTVTMIASLLGVSSRRRKDFVRWTQVVAAFIGPAADDPARRSEFRQTLTEMEHFLEHTITTESGRSGTVLSSLSTACQRGDVSRRELLDFMILLIVAGHETTTRWIYQAVLCLERFPHHLDLLRANPQLISTFLEEVVRYLPPAGGVDRFTTAATTLAGQPVAANQRVVALISTANRDPLVFANPDTFDPVRTPNPHLSFGRGVHACLGAHLARREARIALGALLHHIPGRWQIPDDSIDATTTPVGVDIHRMTVMAGASV